MQTTNSELSLISTAKAHDLYYGGSSSQEAAVNMSQTIETHHNPIVGFRESEQIVRIINISCATHEKN
jgi:hypothetical protein